MISRVYVTPKGCADHLPANGKAPKCQINRVLTFLRDKVNMQCSPNLYPSDGKVISMLAFGYQRGSAAVASSVMTTGIIYLSWLSDNLPTRQAVRSKHHVASTSDQL